MDGQYPTFVVYNKDSYIIYILNEIIALRSRILEKIKQKDNEEEAIEDRRLKMDIYHLLLDLKTLNLLSERNFEKLEELTRILLEKLRYF